MNRYRKTKQNRIAASPPFTAGKKFCGVCAMKYATAIMPERTNATGRVKRPISSRMPP